MHFLKLRYPFRPPPLPGELVFMFFFKAKHEKDPKPERLKHVKDLKYPKDLEDLKFNN